MTDSSREGLAMCDVWVLRSVQRGRIMSRTNKGENTIEPACQNATDGRNKGGTPHTTITENTGRAESGVPGLVRIRDGNLERRKRETQSHLALVDSSTRSSNIRLCFQRDRCDCYMNISIECPALDCVDHCCGPLRGNFRGLSRLFTRIGS